MNPLLQYAVWAKAPDHPFIPGAKMDAYGNPMKWEFYGVTSSEFGWELDHHPVPKALGGPDRSDNLRALSCRQNRSNGGLLGNMLREVSEAKPQNHLTVGNIFGFSRPR